MSSEPVSALRAGLERAAEEIDEYAPEHEHRPLAAYAAVCGVFGVTFTGALAAAASGRGLPERVGAGDVVMIGLATQKLSRLIAKDRVTAFLRAPFTEYQGRAGHGEIDEKARGTGMQLAMGELLICPYCLSQWIVGGFAVGLVAAPRVTRLLSGMWAAYAVADMVQVAYSAAENRA